MEEALALLNAARPPLTVVAGGELDLGEVGAPLDVLLRFGLGGSKTLLIETPYTAWPLDLPDKLFRLHAQGFRTMLAHPERNPDVQDRPQLGLAGARRGPERAARLVPGLTGTMGP